MIPQSNKESEYYPKTAWEILAWTLKYAGPTTVIAGVLLYQGFKIMDLFTQERQVQMQYQQELTEKVVEGLTKATDGLQNSTNATIEMKKQSEIQTQIISDQNTILQDNNNKLEKIINRQDIIIEHSKKAAENNH